MDPKKEARIRAKLAKYGNSDVLDFAEQEGILPSKSPLDNNLDLFITQDIDTIKLKLKLKKLAYVEDSVLITGESGTGKELVARILHSNRHTKNLVCINCTSLPPELLESELFGHIKGAFTGAFQEKRGLLQEADGGTLFLDEIGDMPPHLQAKLLRVLQERKARKVGSIKEYPITCRVVSATHRDVNWMINESLFRPDLYYRLCTFHTHIKPLRERTNDIPLLLDYYTRNEEKIDRSVLCRYLMSIPLHGNVRELISRVRRYVVLGEL